MSWSLFAGMAGTAIAQMAMPTTTDFPCWMMDTNGQVIDMGYMCQVKEPDTPAFQTAEVGAGEVATPPIAGASCDAFATQGEAQYHYLLGTSPEAADADTDGMACESFGYAGNRADGALASRYRSTQYEGVDIELFDVGRRTIDGEFYLRVTAPGLGIFTTRSFANKPDAMDHIRVYYGYTQSL